MSITLVLIILTGLVSYQAMENMNIKGRLVLHPYSMKRQNEWYRFLTSGLIHGDWGHFGVNMFVLYQFGTYIEGIFEQIFEGGMGRIVFLLFYLSAIIFSSVPSYLKHQDNAYYSALGASGATSALVLVYVFFNPWGWFIFPPLPALIFAGAYLWYSSYMSKNARDNIGHDAHYWGAVYGIAFIVSVAFLYDGKYDLIGIFLNQFLAGPTAPNFIG